MIDMCLEEAVQALGAVVGNREQWPSVRHRPFPPVSIDSRSIDPGEAFIAIQGRHHDGHHYIERALEAGAGVVVSSDDRQERDAYPDRVFLKVRDTRAALQTLAHYVRRKWNRPLIGITGSVGKTTTRQFTATLLGRRFRVFQSPGNFNNEFGVPLSLLQLSSEDEVAVLELAMSHAGEIRLLSAISSPTIAVLTNVQPVHLEFFSSIEEIAAAKGEILERLPAEGLLVYNADDPQVAGLAAGFPGTRLSFGLHTDCDCRVSTYRFHGLEGMEFSLFLKGDRLDGWTPFTGKHFLYNLAASAAVAVGMGLNRTDIATGIRHLQVARMRGEVLRVELSTGGVLTILDDSYNSNPAALSCLFECLQQLSGFERQLIALGEMLELGDASPELHRQAGRELAAGGADLLVTVGHGGRHLLEGARERGFPDSRAHHFDHSEEAAEFLLGEVRPNDLLVCKGSRATRMDRIVARILSEGGVES